VRGECGPDVVDDGPAVKIETHGHRHVGSHVDEGAGLDDEA
jgi:hypothetical protein